MTWSLVQKRCYRDKKSYLNSTVSKHICDRGLTSYKPIAGFVNGRCGDGATASCRPTSALRHDAVATAASGVEQPFE
jgi:hypothetical protein